MKLLQFIFRCVFLSTAMFQTSGSEPFSVTMHPPEAPVRIGAEVRMSVTTRNTSNHEIRFARGFGDQELDFQIEVRDPQGKTPAMTESYRNFKEHPTSRGGSYSTYVLEPGKSFDDELVVTKLYVLAVPGKYTISVTRGQRPMWQTPKNRGVGSSPVTVTLIP